jgi:threonine aldolase
VSSPDFAKLAFYSDYMEGAHPAILQRLTETNMMKTAGYGADEFSESARQKIREACQCPDAEIHFLVGGTQTNATVIDAMLRSYQGVIAAAIGHISMHEAGAIEFGGHKVLALRHRNGKISADDVQACIDGYWKDGNHEHMVMPGLVYISQPTEYGTLYSLAELTAISGVCKNCGIPLFVDGARLAYALACPQNDAALPDLARLCDVFYIGGTKCGALFGEAVVFPRPNTVPHFFTIVKQHGALLAKGRIAGIQFDTLFTDHLYVKAGQKAIEAADRIRTALTEKGYQFAFDSPTNQIFLLLSEAQLQNLSAKVEMSFWENTPDGNTIMRIATSWATQAEDVERLIACLS